MAERIGQRRAARDDLAAGPAEGEIAVRTDRDAVAEPVHQPVVIAAQAAEVVQAGGPVLAPRNDVVRLDATAVAAGEPAASVVPLPHRTAQGRRRFPVPPSDVKDIAVPVVRHPADHRVAAELLKRGGADRRAVVDVTTAGRVTRQGGGVGMHDDVMHVRVAGIGGLRRDEGLGDGDQRVGQAAGSRPVRAPRFRGNAASRRDAVSRGPPGFGAGLAARSRGVLRLQFQQRGPQGGEHGHAIVRGQPRRDGHRPVVLEAPGQAAGQQRLLIVGPGDLTVRPGEALQLVRGHRGGHLGQARITIRGGDPGQRPGLGVRQPAGRELGVDDVFDTTEPVRQPAVR